jgi:malonate decarboxylase alpha subunit
VKGPVLAQNKIVETLESVIQSGDRIVMEGDNQKLFEQVNGRNVY